MWPNNNKWSKRFDIRPPRCRRPTVQSYSPGCANVPSHMRTLARVARRIRLNLCYLRPNRDYNPNGKSIGSASFAKLTAECRGHVLSPNNYPFAWGSGPHLIHASLSPRESTTQTGFGPPSNTWFLVRTQLLTPNGISIGSAVIVGLTTVTDRQATLAGL